jgi:glycosyltransferase involved in cell wall biosynthesis
MNISAYPMHGLSKMLTEGFRTRDAHLIEWFARLGNEVEVHSRPDPAPLVWRARWRRTESSPEGVIDRSRTVLRIPNLMDRTRWWVDSLRYYRAPAPASSIISWTPFAFQATGVRDTLQRTTMRVHFDLLDDWSIHHAFSGLRPEIESAYQHAFERAGSVTANSEGTLALAHRFGRRDAVLLPNGVDPERFPQTSTASGAPTIGYFGKIGRRLDDALIRDVARALPEFRFVFAGPVLERATRTALNGLPNVQFLGDIPYSRAAETLASFDVGWVPHGVERGQVGGDAIKIYEYRAAGLPVVTTPIIGVRERPIPGVLVAEAARHHAVLRSLFPPGSSRAPRDCVELPIEHTWQYKAQFILGQLAAS